MNILPISSNIIKITNFTGKPKRRGNTDRTATVQDLYELEDRINAKNKELIEKQNQIIFKMKDIINYNNDNLILNQNKMVGEALFNMTKLIYFRPLATSHDCFIAAKKSSETLQCNGGK